MKRFLIPIIVKGLRYICGTATESYLKNIHSSISRLAMSQEEIAYVVDEIISVINITRVEMSEKRQALNKIIGRLGNFDVKLGNITQALEKEVSQVRKFVQLYIELDAIIQALRKTVSQDNSYMEHVWLQLSMLSLGNLSLSIIIPRRLKDLILEIENHLPQYLKLQYDPKET